jgi:hypothetical protein
MKQCWSCCRQQVRLKLPFSWHPCCCQRVVTCAGRNGIEQDFEPSGTTAPASPIPGGCLHPVPRPLFAVSAANYGPDQDNAAAHGLPKKKLPLFALQRTSSVDSSSLGPTCFLGDNIVILSKPLMYLYMHPICRRRCYEAARACLNLWLDLDTAILHRHLLTQSMLDATASVQDTLGMRLCQAMP